MRKACAVQYRKHDCMISRKLQRNQAPTSFIGIQVRPTSVLHPVASRSDGLYPSIGQLPTNTDVVLVHRTVKYKYALANSYSCFIAFNAVLTNKGRDILADSVSDHF